jgi:rifampicin phosphotransferase
VTPWVVNLSAPEAADADLVGAKAAQLHRLCAAGMPVPEACVVTVSAFRAHFPAATPAAAPAVSPCFHPELTRGLDRAVLDLFGSDDVYLAVRSSAVGEDGANASFAGAHETYYYVRPSGLTEAVQACWASLWSRPALSYRRQHKAAGGEFAMAVIVQRMVQADRSGVCFTSDPTGQQPGHVWIEAIWGLGAALVDGRVTPDRLLLDRSGRLLRRQIGRKRHQVAAALRHPQRDRLDPVPSFQQSQPVLDDREAVGVLEMSLAAELLFGSPQDVEWSFEGDRFFVLQSRPVTAMAEPAGNPLTAPSRRAAGGGRSQETWVLFKPIAENFTDPLTPMTVDLFRRVLPRGARFFDGRLYLNLDRAAALSPVRWTRQQLADVLLLRGGMPKTTWNPAKLPLAVAAVIVAYLVDGIAWHRTSRLNLDGLGRFERVCNKVRNAPRYDALRALQRLVFGRHPFEPIGRQAFYVNASSLRYFLLLGALLGLLSRYAPKFDRHQISQLCSGDGSTWSRQMVEGVRALADVARCDPELTRQLTDGDGSGVNQTLAQLPQLHPFALAVTDFLQRFGHRCAAELELATPRWREDPAALLRMVRNYLKAPVQAPEDPQAHLQAATEALRAALPRRWQQRLALYLVERIRYYVSLRENTRHYHAMAMDVTRSKLLDLEQVLLAEGRLRVPGDVFYLNWEEAEGLAARRLDWRDVAGTVRRRRRSRGQAARAGANDLVTTGRRGTARSGTDPGGAAAMNTSGRIIRQGSGGAGASRRGGDRSLSDGAAPGAAVVLVGQCASPGTAEGRVRIILDPATAADLEPGDVLVAPFTDPAWTPLFPLAAAVVVEVGSFLSHAGTVAREYRIPCLVDVERCTSRLRDGQRVRVVASEGRLEVLEP